MYVSHTVRYTRTYCSGRQDYTMFECKSWTTSWVHMWTMLYVSSGTLDDVHSSGEWMKRPTAATTYSTAVIGGTIVNRTYSTHIYGRISFTYFYQQKLVIFTMVPRNISAGRKKASQKKGFLHTYLCSQAIFLPPAIVQVVYYSI